MFLLINIYISITLHLQVAVFNFMRPGVFWGQIMFVYVMCLSQPPVQLLTWLVINGDHHNWP